MNHQRKVALFALMVSLASTHVARAQDPSASGEKPNLLLIIDTSGSMEYKTGSDEFPACTPDDPSGTNERSRWIEVVEAMTGSIQNYSCESVDRNTTAFAQEFGMPGGAADPPDFNYRNPYHRPLSSTCGYTPDRSTPAPTNAFEWRPPLEAQYPIDANTLTGCTTPFAQNANGVLDSFDDLVRFGLMTFDPLPDDGQGHNSFGPNYVSGVRGTWSYIAGSFATGHPANCAASAMDQMMEVGVRNGAAPASEGKMIPFGDQFADDIDDADRHNRIQQVLLATRPYGGTPLNGALEDARYFFHSDNDTDPLDPDYGDSANESLWISPRYDEKVNCGCRDQHIVLITDGEPNLDLRPYCEQTGSPDGKCPFPDNPETIISELYDVPTVPPADALGSACAEPHLSNTFYTHKIRTHVIGYVAETYNYGGLTYDCAALQVDHADWNAPGGLCDSPSDEDLRVCCSLHTLARAGSDPSTAPSYPTGSGDPDIKDSNGQPYIAPDGNALTLAMGDLIQRLLPKTASATRPVRSPGIGRQDDQMVGFRLLTSFDSQGGGSNVWKGEIERMRWTCSGGGSDAVEEEKDEAQGDDFSFTTAKNKTSREFVTWLPTSSYTADDLRRSLRPHVSAPNDGVTPTQGVARTNDIGQSFSDNVSPTALDLLNFGAFGPCSDATSDTQCRDRVMNWLLGFDDGVGNNRCADITDSTCSVIGDILHSTPVIVNRPNAPLDDATYTAFSNGPAGSRMMMAYLSSNDGFIHGFAASPNDSADSPITDDDTLNERFAAIPPMLLPELKDQYPATRLKLLDGEPVVQDVVATGTSFPYALERDTTGSTGATWRTVLVQSFGGSKSGYFALDITDTGNPSDGGSSGPQLLWQLTTTAANGQPLFGYGGTPTIATVYLETGLSPKEVAVAILPGGKGPSPGGVPVLRSDPNINNPAINTHYRANTATDTELSGTVAPRSYINDYSATAARSLTIVRLDTGEILRTFRRSADLPSPTNDISTSVITDENSSNPVYLDSPITGIPAAFPSGPGMIADRIFVGDQDGTMWRIDVSDPDPSNWEMKLFHDAFGSVGGDEGQPITTQPVLSVDDVGQITVAFSTGAQDLSGGNGDTHYVYSLTEREYGTDFISKLNWYNELEDGEHVLGPMELLAGTLYYATYNPAATNACVQGISGLYAQHYTESNGSPGEGGSAALRRVASTVTDPDAEPEDFIQVSQALSEQNPGSGADVGAVFGFSLEYTPSCYDESAETAAYLSGGTKVNNASSARLQLVFQTAGGVQAAQSDLGFDTGFAAIDIASPPQASTILSWAAVLD